MTGEELRTKAINGARGCLAWDMLSASEKGMWNNAALELGHEKDLAAADARSFEAGLVLGYLSKHKRLDFTDPFTTGAVENIRRGVHRE